MGGASFAASFAAGYGGKIITHLRANILFILFVILGSVTCGKNVTMTLANDIIPVQFMTDTALVIIFASAGLGMFIANIMNIPQSTSLVTVAAIAGVGAYFKILSIKTLLYFLPFWILLPVICYLITHRLTNYFYPPRKSNFWVYEKFVNQEHKLKFFVIITACYSAFSVGSNNVANVAAPYLAYSKLTMPFLLFLFAIVYGLGGFIFTGPIKTAGQKIVPLGLLTASVISLVSGTMMLLASYLGIPQSFVMLKMGSLFAVSTLKHGSELTFSNPITQKTFYTWTINPLIVFLLSYALSGLLFIR